MFFCFLVHLKVPRLTVKIKTGIHHYTLQLDTDTSSSLTRSSATKLTPQSKEAFLLFFLQMLLHKHCRGDSQLNIFKMDI